MTTYPSESLSDPKLIDVLLVNNFQLTVKLSGTTLADSDNFITLDHTDQIYQLYRCSLRAKKRKKKISGKLLIQFPQNCQNIDLSFIAIFALFKQENSDVQIKFDLSLIEDNSHRAKIHTIIFNLEISYRTSNKELSKGVFEIVPARPDIHDAHWKYVSNEVLPLIYINASNLKDDFINPCTYFNLKTFYAQEEYESLVKNFNFHYNQLFDNENLSISTKVYRAIKHALLIAKTNEKINKKIIYYLYYLRLLEELNIIKSEIELQLNIQIKGKEPMYRAHRKLDQNKNRKYEAEMAKIVDLVKVHPPVLILLFTIIVINSLPSEIDDKVVKLEDYISIFKNLYEFTKSFYRGIIEIARNVVEHSTHHHGVLCARLFKGRVIKTQKSQLPEFIEEYLGSLKGRIPNMSAVSDMEFLNVTIIDDGTEGIVKKAIENLESKLQEYKGNKMVAIYQEDIDKLKNVNQFDYMDVFNYNNIKLRHQAIRSASQWGLLIFANLMEKNNGFIFSASLSGRDNRKMDYCIKFKNQSKKSKILSDNTQFRLGTFYDIIVPINKWDPVKADYLAQVTPPESYGESVSFSELFNYRYFGSGSHSNIRDAREKILFEINLKASVAFTSEPEKIFASEVVKRIKEFEISLKERHIDSTIIPVIDLEMQSELFDPSVFFRFISYLQFEMEISNIIVINTPVMMVKNMFDTLSLVEVGLSKIRQQTGLGFWNQDCFIIFYSWDKTDNGDRVYYTDLLGGNQFNDFKLLNYKIGHTHFSFTEKQKDQRSKDIDTLRFSTETESAAKRSPLFYKGSVRLHNFELVIEHNGLKLFEHMAKAILNKDI